MLVYMFYILLPFPILIADHIKNTALDLSEKSTAQTKHYAIFFTAGIMVSSFALPIILARSPDDKPIVSIRI